LGKKGKWQEMVLNGKKGLYKGNTNANLEGRETMNNRQETGGGTEKTHLTIGRWDHVGGCGVCGVGRGKTAEAVTERDRDENTIT